MTLYLSANYNDTAVKLNLKKLSDSFHMCPRSAFVLSSGTCHGFFAAWAHSHMVWKKTKKKPWSCMADNAFVPGTRIFFFLNNF